MGVISTALLGALALLGTVLTKLLADEFKAWAPSITSKIVGMAVRRLPAQMHERFSEEWLSHLDEVPGDIGKIIVACGFLFASLDMAEGPFGLRKRALDLVVASCALIFLAPLFAFIAILVAASSRGPILFGQPHIARDGRAFQVLRFRTMRMGGDPRLTAVGSFLRKSNLNELPQLLNVIAGHMSLVGYRPRTLVRVVRKTESADEYKDRHRPGLFEEVPTYARHWSPLVDLKIILASIGASLRGDRATIDLERDWKWGLMFVSPMLTPFVILLRYFLGS